MPIFYILEFRRGIVGRILRSVRIFSRRVYLVRIVQPMRHTLLCVKIVGGKCFCSFAHEVDVL